MPKIGSPSLSVASVLLLMASAPSSVSALPSTHAVTAPADLTFVDLPRLRLTLRDVHIISEWMDREQKKLERPLTVQWEGLRAFYEGITQRCAIGVAVWKYPHGVAAIIREHAIAQQRLYRIAERGTAALRLREDFMLRELERVHPSLFACELGCERLRGLDLTRDARVLYDALFASAPIRPPRTDGTAEPDPVVPPTPRHRRPFASPGDRAQSNTLAMLSFTRLRGTSRE